MTKIRILLLSSVLLTGCADSMVPSSKTAPSSPVVSNLLFYCDSVKWVRVTYESNDNNTGVAIVRCVRTGDKLYYLAMKRKYSGFTGPFGGVEVHEGYDRVMEICDASGDKIQIPEKQDGIESVVLFIKEVKRGIGVNNHETWRYYELPQPHKDEIRIPNVTMLNTTDRDGEYDSIIAKIDNAEKEVESLRHNQGRR